MFRKFKKLGLGLLGHVTPSIFFRRILRSDVLVYNSFFFSEQPFYGNYSTLDSHTNTVNFSRVCLLVKMASKTVTKSIKLTIKINRTTITKTRRTLVPGVFPSPNQMNGFSQHM